MIRRIAGLLMCIAGVFGLASCANNSKNYSGPVVAKEEVAFVFSDDTSLRGKLIANNIEGVADNEMIIPAGRDVVGSLVGVEPSHCELLPGSYSVEAWVTRRVPPTREPHRRISRKFGPIEAEFTVEPGHIYAFAPAKRYADEKKLWGLTFRGKPHWELEIQDVTSSAKYQSYVASAR